MLVTMSFVSVIGSSIEEKEAKESPLYKIRTKRSIGERIGSIIENIKTKFLGDRMFYFPFKLIFNGEYWSPLATVTGCTVVTPDTCKC